MRPALRPLSLLVAAIVGASLVTAISEAQSATAATPAANAQIAAIPPVPPRSTSHYVRTITGPLVDSSSAGEGCADATSGSTFVLLDIGAQLNDGTGVALTVVNTRVAWAALRTAINGYTASFASCHTGPTATIAVGTNNEGSFTAFSATNRGTGWADHVINRLAPQPGLTLVGANDIEANFASSEAQAEAWETAYLKKATGVLIFNGAASGCPTTPGVTKHSCSPVRDDNHIVKTWTQAQYYRLAHALSPTRIRALPQIYRSGQATQWANIDATGTKNIPFVGALTEHAASPTTFTPAQGWTALCTGLERIGVAPGTVVTDLKIDS
jgi:hypothetical protein